MKCGQRRERTMKEFNELDDDGNELLFDGEYFKLSLVKEESRMRKIGRFSLSSKGNPWYIKDGLVEDKHMFGTRSDNYPLSWGLHESLIRRLPDDAMIGLKTDNGKYSISVKDAMDNKFYRKFKGQGFELQMFVPLECWREH